MIECDTKTLLKLPASFIVGGLNKRHENCLMVGSNKNGVVDFTEVPMFIYPPVDMGINTAQIILCKNIKETPELFVEKTITDVASVSDWVSNSGTKWIFDIRSGLSKYEKF